MKNIHVLPTEKPSRLYLFEKILKLGGLTTVVFKNSGAVNQHIYITSDEEIKEGWCIDKHNVVYKQETDKIFPTFTGPKKIILTTDQGLIKDGVQSIDDEFLEWFVKNPSCEEVEIENKKVLVGWEPDYTYEDLGIDGSKNVYHNFYKIIIPQEEPKQECSQLGTKELNDLASAFFAGKLNHLASAYFGGEPKQETLEELIEQFKKK